MVKEDPLHRLLRTTTTAFRNQQFSVWKEAEKDRVQEIPQWLGNSVQSNTFKDLIKSSASLHNHCSQSVTRPSLQTANDESSRVVSVNFLC
jgi:acyl-homoserine lactone acylase PvdQ